MKTFICLSLQSSVRSYSKQARSSELKLKSKFKSLFINQNVLIRIKTTSKTTHTLSGHRRSIHDEILRRTCDLYSAASRVRSENRADEFSCDAGLWLGEKNSLHTKQAARSVCTPLQDLCLFLLSLLMFLHKHTELDQSIPPMSCCLYDGVTRLPVAWPPSALPFSPPPPPIPPPPIPPTPPRPELPRASGTTGKEGRSPL